MFDRRFLTAIAVSAVLSLAATCDNGSQAPLILSPQGGQLLRDAGAFGVEIEASSEFFDLSTLEARLNGDALDVVLGESTHRAVLGAGQSLDADNEVVVSARRLADAQTGVSSVEFDWQVLSPALDFQVGYVSQPPPVESADVQLLDTGALHQNALLHVRYRPGFAAPSQIPYRVDEQTVYILRDDGIGDDAQGGDGLYSARIDFDYNRYALRRALDLVGPGSALAADEKSTFQGRKVVFTEPLNAQTDLADLLGHGQGVPIPLFPLPATRSLFDHEQALLVRHPSVVTDPDLTFDLCDIDGDGNLGNPDGPWTFKTLMTAMANEPRTGVSPEEFVREWVRGWETDPATGENWIVNNDEVPARNVQAILDGWEDPDSGVLDLDVSPFRLLGIVNRLDLRDAVGYGGPGTAGELRFVFGLVESAGGGGGPTDPPGTDPDGGTLENNPSGEQIVGEVIPGPIPGGSCGTRRMTVIFEYKVDADSCQDVLSYAEAWENLDIDPRHPEFDSMTAAELADFKADLQAITDGVVLADAAPGRPNGNAIGQIRTNEFVMGSPWEMREFTLQAFGDGTSTDPQLPNGLERQAHVLRLDTSKQTPDLDYALPQNTFLQQVLASFINDTNGGVLQAICHGEHVVPEWVLAGGDTLPVLLPFLAGRADFMVFDQASTHFSTPGINGWDDPDGARSCEPAEIRFNFSSTTCTGCHGADLLDPSADPAFYHVNPNVFDSVEGAELSRFMTGTREDEDVNTPIPDPSAYGGQPQHFFDLARRASDMQGLLATQCVNLMVASQPNSSFVH